MNLFINSESFLHRIMKDLLEMVSRRSVKVEFTSLTCSVSMLNYLSCLVSVCENHGKFFFGFSVTSSWACNLEGHDL